MNLSTFLCISSPTDSLQSWKLKKRWTSLRFLWVRIMKILIYLASRIIDKTYKSKERNQCKARPKAQVCPADFKYRFQNLRRINWNTRLVNQMLTNKTRHVSFKDARNQLYDPLIILLKDKILSDFKEIYYVDQKRQQALFDTIHNFLLTPPFSLFVFLLFPSSAFFYFPPPNCWYMLLLILCYSTQ